MVLYCALQCANYASNNIVFLVSGNSSSSESDGSFDAEEFQRAVQDLSFELLGKKYSSKNNLHVTIHDLELKI